MRMPAEAANESASGRSPQPAEASAAAPTGCVFSSLLLKVAADLRCRPRPRGAAADYGLPTLGGCSLAAVTRISDHPDTRAPSHGTAGADRVERRECSVRPPPLCAERATLPPGWPCLSVTRGGCGRLCEGRGRTPSSGEGWMCGPSWRTLSCVDDSPSWAAVTCDVWLSVAAVCGSHTCVAHVGQFCLGDRQEEGSGENWGVGGLGPWSVRRALD